jgi:hypothetical protein
VYDAWNDVVVGNYYGSFSMTASNQGAQTYFITPTNLTALTPPWTDIPIQFWQKVDATSPTWGSGFSAVPELGFTVPGGGQSQRVGIPIPKHLVTTTKLKAVCRIQSNGSGTLKLYWLVGTELNNSSATDGNVFSVAVTTSLSYFTNTFNVVANPDSVGMWIGVDSTSSQPMNLYNVTVQAQ